MKSGFGYKHRKRGKKMNEEKVISILRYFGVSRCRPIVSTYRMQKVFGLQWKTAKRWVRIMSALPQEDWSADRVHEQDRSG